MKRFEKELESKDLPTGGYLRLYEVIGPFEGESRFLIRELDREGWHVGFPYQAETKGYAERFFKNLYRASKVQPKRSR